MTRFTSMLVSIAQGLMVGIVTLRAYPGADILGVMSYEFLLIITVNALLMALYAQLVAEYRLDSKE